MEYEIYNTNDELTHWGIKGMKWGIRRFQNKDGSLTSEGRKHRAKQEGKKVSAKAGSKVAAKSSTKASNAKKVEEAEVPKKKSISEMTDAELREHTNRMMLETQYHNAAKSLAAANPPKVSAGKKFITSVLNDVVAPAAKNAGRSWAEKFLKDKLGLNEEDPIAKMEKQVKKLELSKRIEDLKKGRQPDELADLEKQYKKLDWEKKIRDLESNDSERDILSEALDLFRNTSPEERQEIKDAAGMLENLDKINKKGKTNT